MRKQPSGGVTPQINSVKGSELPKKLPKKFALLDLQSLCFISTITGKPTNVEDASNAEFKQFISQYVQVQGEDLETWPLEERRDVLNFAVEQGQSPKFLPNLSEASSGSQKGTSENENQAL
jgi:hypothetical protein